MDQFFTLKDGRHICYRIHGAGEPLLLIAGLAYQLITWHPSLIKALTNEGYQLILMDNRDAGKSSLIETRPPSKLQLLLKKIPSRNYVLQDVANDVIALLDHLKIEKTHILGMSMGGMIGQTVAAFYPERVKSLISIFSTTGHHRVGQPSLAVKLEAIKPRNESKASYLRFMLALMRIINGTKFSIDWDWYRQICEEQFERQGGDMEAPMFRQLGSFIKPGDRANELKKITAPTLVIHGSRDRLVDTSGGYATAKAITHAKLKIIEGMGHVIPETLLPEILPEIFEIMGKV